MAGVHGYEPQPQKGSIKSSEVGAFLAQQSAAQQAPPESPMPMQPQMPAAPMMPERTEIGSALAAAMNDTDLVSLNGGTGFNVRPKNPLADGRLAALGVSPTEIALLRRARVI